MPNYKVKKDLETKKSYEYDFEPMIFDTPEPRITINERTLVIPDELKTLGVENDNDVERIFFEVPRYFDEVNDLSEFTWYVNYLNANQEPNKYHCDDVEVEGDNIVFSWLTSKHVYSYRGVVRFIICAVSSDGRKWNSTIAEINVLEGLETDEQIIDNNPDIINELLELKPKVEQALSKATTLEATSESLLNASKEIQEKVNSQQTQIDNAIDVMGDYEIVSEDTTQIRFKKGNGQFGDTVNLGDGLASKSMVNQGGQIFASNEFHGDTSDYGLEIETIKGNFYQEKTNGYQLFDASRLQTKQQGGATVTNNGDGSFTIGVGSLPNTLEELPIDDGFTNNRNNGLTLEEPPYEVGIDDDFSQMPLADLTSGFTIFYDDTSIIKLLKEGNITFDCKYSTYPFFEVQFRKSDGSVLLSLTNRDNNKDAKNITSDILQQIVNVRLYIYGSSGSTIVPGTIKPMLYQDGDGTWERFTGGKPAPSPEYPLEPKFFESKNVYSSNKNKINVDNIEMYFQSTNNQTNMYKISNLKPNTKYTMSSDIPKTDIATIYFAGGISGTHGVYIGIPRTFESTNDGELEFQIRVDDKSVYTLNDLKSKRFYIQLEEGEQATKYQEGVLNNTPFPITLRALPNGVCDTYKNGILSRYAGVLKPTRETPTNDSDFTNNCRVSYIPLDRKYPVEISRNIICNISFPQSTESSGEIDVVSQQPNNGAIHIWFKKGRFASLDEYYDWLDNNDIEIYYELATPTTEYLSLPTIPSYFPYTNAWHDSEVEATEMQWKAKVYDSLEAQDDFIEEDYIKVTETDDVVSTSSHRGGAELLAMDGAYEQVTTKGHQLFDKSKLPTKSQGGATVTNNGDGSFTISGSGNLTNTLFHSYTISNTELKKMFKKGLMTLKSGNVTYPYFEVIFTKGSSMLYQISNFYNAISSKEITDDLLNDSEVTIRIDFYGKSGSTIKGGTIKPMLYQDGDGTFEPFTGGQPSPNPDYAQDMKAVEVSEIYSIGKNMFDLNGITKGTVEYYNGIRCLKYTDDANYFKLDLSWNTSDNQMSLTSKLIRRSGSTDKETALCFVYEDGSYSSDYFYPNKIKTIVSKKGKVVKGVRGNWNNGTHAYLDLSCTSLYYGINTQPYVEMKSSTTPFNLKLRALPNGVKDTYENGVVTRIVGTHKITSIDSIQTGEQNGMKYYVVNVSNKNQNSVNVEGFLVNSIKKINSSEASSNPDIENCIFQNPKNLVIRGTKTDTLETFKEKFLNTEIWYELATPTTEVLDKPFIETYDKWVNIWTDSPVDSHMKIGFNNRFGEFYTKKEVDEMIAQLQDKMIVSFANMLPTSTQAEMLEEDYKNLLNKMEEL